MKKVYTKKTLCESEHYFMKVSLLLLFFSLFSLNLLGDSFFIKLGSYQNNQSVLAKIQTLPSPLKERLLFTHKAHLYRLYSYRFENLQETLPYLKAYQAYFPDAYITIHGPSHALAFLQPTPKEASHVTSSPSIPLQENSTILTPTSKTHTQDSLATRLSGHTFYICSNTIKTAQEKKLLSYAFDQNSTLTILPLHQKTAPLKLYYLTDKEKFYLSRDGRIRTSLYYTMTAHYIDYDLVTQWSKGKKIQSLRYYKKRHYAESYLNSLHF